MTVNVVVQESGEEGWIPELAVDISTFAGRLRYLRLVLDTSVSEIARRCELDDGSWRNWEAGVRPRDREEVAVKIARATGANLTWLMLGGKKGANLTTLRKSVTRGPREDRTRPRKSRPPRIGDRPQRAA